MRKRIQSRRFGAKQAVVVVSAVMALSLALMSGCQAAPASNGGSSQGDANTAANSAPTDNADKAATDAKATADEKAAASNADKTAAQPSVAGVFTDRDSGVLPESFYTTDYMNAGNRGCNSCHEDLYSLIENTNPLPHLLGPARYGKNYTYLDCTTCHSMKSAFGGIEFSDTIHASHYSNPAFTQTYAGNCFSCHATDTNDQLVMYDVWKYSPDFGGYVNGGDATSQWWNARRGFTSGSVTGLSAINNIDLDVTITQPVIENEKDLYVVNNYEIPSISESEYRFTVTGTKGDREFTLEELKALPATEMQVTQSCMTNPINSSLIASWPVKGVLLKDIIEACGGLADGMQSVSIMTGDNWEVCMSMDVQELIDRDALVAYEFFGHELTPEWGYPAVTVIPGYGASRWGKWTTGLVFADTPGATCTWDTWYVMPKAIQGLVCAGWFNPVKDDMEFKAGETIDLDGYAYVGVETDSQGISHEIAAIQFSADRGATWQTVELPSGFDKYQWARFSAPWTPEKPGVYTLQVRAVDAGGQEQYWPASVIINVTE